MKSITSNRYHELLTISATEYASIRGVNLAYYRARGMRVCGSCKASEVGSVLDQFIECAPSNTEAVVACTASISVERSRCFYVLQATALTRDDLR